MQDRGVPETGVHPILAEVLNLWRQTCSYDKPEDWVFASCQHRGRKPLWDQAILAILRKYVRPAAERIGIHKRIGWHTFRHTYSTLLRSVGAEFKVMQELMRHSSLRSTLNVYKQAVTPAKHEAQAAVLSLVFSSQVAKANAELPPPRLDEVKRRRACPPLERVQKGRRTVSLLHLRMEGET
jgi:integrase